MTSQTRLTEPAGAIPAAAAANAAAVLLLLLPCCCYLCPQNLALAVVSVIFATVPTVAGFFPLWLAVTLHEGSTLLVALNSLRLLLESGQQEGNVVPPPKDSSQHGQGRAAAEPKLATQQA